VRGLFDLIDNQKDKGVAGKEKRPIDVLKESVGGVSKELLERYKAQNRVLKAIRGALKSGPKTVPDLEEELKLSTNTIFWYLMAMRKYGEVEEIEERGSYIAYGLKKEEDSN